MNQISSPFSVQSTSATGGIEISTQRNEQTENMEDMNTKLNGSPIRKEYPFFSSGKFGVFEVRWVDLDEKKENDYRGMVKNLTKASGCICCLNNFLQILRCRKCSGTDSGGMGQMCAGCYKKIKKCPACSKCFSGCLMDDVIFKNLEKNEMFKEIKLDCIVLGCPDCISLDNLEDHWQISHKKMADQRSLVGLESGGNDLSQHHDLVTKYRCCTEQQGAVYKILHGNDSPDSQYWQLCDIEFSHNFILELLAFNQNLHQRTDLTGTAASSINTPSGSASCSSVPLTEYVACDNPTYMNEVINMKHSDGRMRRTIYRLGAACSKNDLEKIANLFHTEFNYYRRNSKKLRSLSRFLIDSSRYIRDDKFKLNYLVELFNKNGLNTLSMVITEVKNEEESAPRLNNVKSDRFPLIHKMMENQSILRYDDDKFIGLAFRLKDRLNCEPELCYSFFNAIYSNMMKLSELEDINDPDVCDFFVLTDIMSKMLTPFSYLLEVLDCYSEVALLKKIEEWAEKNSDQI